MVSLRNAFMKNPTFAALIVKQERAAALASKDTDDLRYQRDVVAQKLVKAAKRKQKVRPLREALAEINNQLRVRQAA